MASRALVVPIMTPAEFVGNVPTRALGAALVSRQRWQAQPVMANAERNWRDRDLARARRAGGHPTGQFLKPGTLGSEH